MIDLDSKPVELATPAPVHVKHVEEEKVQEVSLLPSLKRALQSLLDLRQRDRISKKPRFSSHF
jgi:hypothetical protein